MNIYKAIRRIFGPFFLPSIILGIVLAALLPEMDTWAYLAFGLASGFIAAVLDDLFGFRDL